MHGIGVARIAGSVLAGWLMIAGSASAQGASCCGTWEQVATTGPGARSNTAVAFDSARGKVVLYGGQRDSTVFGDTWEWDGTSWHQVASTGPGPRAAHVLVYDGVTHRVLLFGGYDDTFSLQPDTWEWDGNAWTRVATTGPLFRHNAAAAFDSRRGRVVLFGGQFPIPLGDTWEWDGAAWTQVASTGPSPRTEAAMAYDPTRGRIVLFGGQAIGGGQLGDTWEWDGTVWTQLASTGPSARQDHAMAFAGTCSQVLLFGGIGASGYDDDLWSWNGSAWKRQDATGPAARYIHAMTLDAARGSAVLFGGQTSTVTEGDTWALGLAPTVVTNNLDRGAGSLRDAIAATCDGGTITFAPSVASPITLASHLDIEKSLTIQGPGAAALTVSGSHLDRVFTLGATASSFDVTISGLTIADGHIQLLSGQEGLGGGIYSSGGTLTIADSVVAGNSISGGLEGLGGGIFNSGGTLNVVDSVVSGNSVSSFGGGGGGSDGGGIVNSGSSGTLNVRNSTISGNSVHGVGGLGLGGGIYNNGTGRVNIVDSTLSGNLAEGNAALGGAVSGLDAGTVTITSSTLFGNGAKGCDALGCEAAGGGIYVGNGTATLTSVTLAHNMASAYYGFSGGIYRDHYSLVTVQNTIVAENSAQGVLTRGPDVYSSFRSQGYNLIGNGDGGSGFDAAKHDQVGSAAQPIVPGLDPNGLQDHGGPTLTVALLPGSPAIDQGSPATDPFTQQPITADQRGFPRPIADPAAPGPYPGDQSDIGAFEAKSAGQPAIAAASLDLRQGDRPMTLQIATVSDPGQGAGTLTVAVAAATGSGVTLSNVSIDQDGRVFADVAASCAATDSTFTLTATGSGPAPASATLAVAVRPNTPPVLGSYPGTVGPINPGAGAAVPASAAPADNGTVALAVSAPGLGGSASVSSTTGLVELGQVGPSGPHPVTVTATDNCGATTTRTFTLLVNQPPSIAAQTVMVQRGTLASPPVEIAQVHDAEDPPPALRVTVNGGTSATAQGVTLSQIAIDPAGAVRASLVATCGASSAVFQLTVTDRGGLSANVPLFVTVARNTPPVLGGYPPARVRLGRSTVVRPSAPPADNGVITGITASSPGFGGSLDVDPLTGAVTVAGARPIGTYRVRVRATDNCSATTVRKFALTVTF